MDKAILASWLKAGAVEAGRFSETESGTPQGGIISPTLANMALDGLQVLLGERFGHPNTKESCRHKVNLVRYADDFVITGISEELLKNEVRPLVKGFLKARGLTLSEEKTHITHIDSGFDFLSQNVRKYRGKLLTKPSKAAIKAVTATLAEEVRRMHGSSQAVLIHRLNPIIRGWCQYHRHGVSSQTFHYLDYRLWKLIWRWCRREHGNRRYRWLKDRYFRREGKREWVFSCDTDKGVLRLTRPVDVKIQRHTKIKAAATSYDPKFEAYFEDRWLKKQLKTLKGSKKIASLYQSQRGRCALCYGKLEEDWHAHHILPRHRGGDDRQSNLVLLHATCHRQLHAMGLSVEKPVTEFSVT